MNEDQRMFSELLRLYKKTVQDCNKKLDNQLQHFEEIVNI